MNSKCCFVLLASSFVAHLVWGLPSGAQYKQASPPFPSLRPRQGNATASRLNASCLTRPYFHPTPEKWNASKTDEWLDDWWRLNSNDFEARGGFSATLADQYLNDPDWTCQENGMTNNCNWKPCDVVAEDNEIEQSYYVIESVSRLHSYFDGFRQALLTSATTASLGLQDWAYTFYHDKDDIDMTFIKELINTLAVIISISAIFIAPELSATAAIWLSFGTSNANGFILGGNLYALHTPVDNTPLKAAGLGGFLSGFFANSTTGLITANNALMSGQPAPGTSTDIRGFVKGGTFVNYPGVNQTEAIATLTSLLLATSINMLWKQQKIFIMGGGPCDDSAAIGKGPAEAKLCRDGKAWYLYYWKENLGQLNLGKSHWGYVSSPPGFEHLGSANLTGVTVQDVLSSSVSTHAAGVSNYTAETFYNRTINTLQAGKTDIASLTAGWEGVFTIPVCNLSGILNKPDKEINKKSVILAPWGKNQVPQWCGPVCTNSTGHADAAMTAAFIDAANMHNFDSFTAYCPRGNWLKPRPPAMMGPVY